MKANFKKSGIYKIINLINGNIYIGSSKNIERRFYTHKNKLKNNKHENSYLQNAYNKYSSENFSFEIICECEIDNLKIKEQYYIDTLNPKYNITREVIRNTPSKESREKHSKTKKMMYANGELDYVKKEGRPINQYDLEGNLISKFKHSVEASKSTGISFSTILRCANKQYKTGKGFIWRYDDDESEFDLIRTRKPIMKNSRSKKVKLINIKTGEEKEFDSIKLLSEYLDLPREYVYNKYYFKLILNNKYKIDLVKSDELLES